MRGADGDFFLASGAPGEEKVGEVDAGDEENEADGPHHQPEADAGWLGKKVVFERLDGDGEIGIRFRIGLRELLGDDGHFGVGGFESDAALEFSHYQKEVILALDLIGLEGERDVHGGIADVGRTGSGDAENGVEFAAHAELGADDVGIAAEMVAPEFVVEDDDLFVAGEGVVGNQMAAEDDFRAEEEVEPAGGDAAGLDLLGPVGSGDGEAFAGPAVDGVEEGGLLLPVEEVAGGSAVALAGFVVGPEHDDAVAIDVGERGEEDGIEEAEDSGGGANAQGEGEQGDGSEAGALPEETKAVANVAPEFGHEGNSRCLYC